MTSKRTTQGSLDQNESSTDQAPERVRLLALQAEVGTILATNEMLGAALQHCAEAMVRHIGAAFVRIWTLSESEPIPELQASAGMYTHLDGPHGVPVGKC